MKKYILLLLTVLLFSGCGAGGGSAPPGSTVTAAFDQPTTINFVGNNQRDLTIKVTDPDANVVVNARVVVTAQFSSSQNIDPSTLVFFCGTSEPLFNSDGSRSSFNPFTPAETNDFGVISPKPCINFVKDAEGEAYEVTFTVHMDGAEDTDALITVN